MSLTPTCIAGAALQRLRQGNARYLTAQTNAGDISLPLRQKTCAEGQAPYAVIVACSDSRVIPESIFSAGLGELFVIRVAGNVIDRHQLGSIEYAVDHLGAPLVVVLGHDHCGAVGAAIHSRPAGHIASITDVIRKAIGDETDDSKACCLNVRNSVNAIRQGLSQSPVQVCGAVYHLADGRVEFL